MVLEKRERWLAGAGEGGVGGGEDGEGRGMVEEGTGSELESEGHGGEARILEDLGSVEDGVGRKGREEREEREENERKMERGRHGRGALSSAIRTKKTETKRIEFGGKYWFVDNGSIGRLPPNEDLGLKV